MKLVTQVFEFSEIGDYLGGAFYVETEEGYFIGVLSKITSQYLEFKTYVSQESVTIDDYLHGRVRVYSMKKDELL